MSLPSAQILACSHLVLATDNVTKMTDFFQHAFGIEPHFKNVMFSEFILPSQFRVAFFKPVGTSAHHFKSTSGREACSIGITVQDVDIFFQNIQQAALKSFDFKISGPPKDHHWGEKSLLLIDPDGNRWEVTQSPSTHGMLTNRT